MSRGPAHRVRLVTVVFAPGPAAFALCCGVSSVARAGATAFQAHAAKQSLLVAREVEGAAALPVGATTDFPFGYALDEGAKISLLPPNDASTKPVWRGSQARAMEDQRRGRRQSMA
jgi:hypothetical protein